ncbi:hypothetical protein SLA2020_009350 [Shorea laevis]
MPRSEVLKWVQEYIEQTRSVLREGGWDEVDISDIVDVSTLGFFEEEMVLLDNQAVLNALLLKADRLSASFGKPTGAAKTSRTLQGLISDPRRRENR